MGTPEGYYFPFDVNNVTDFYASGEDSALFYSSFSIAYHIPGLQSGSSPQVPPELLQLYSVGVPAAGATGIQNQQTSPPNRYQSREKSSRPPAASRQPNATGSKLENRPDKGKGREQPTQPSAYLSKQEKRIDKGKGREQPTQPHAYFNETVDPIFMAAPDCELPLYPYPIYAHSNMQPSGITSMMMIPIKLRGEPVHKEVLVRALYSMLRIRGN